MRRTRKSRVVSVLKQLKGNRAEWFCKLVVRVRTMSSGLQHSCLHGLTFAASRLLVPPKKDDHRRIRRSWLGTGRTFRSSQGLVGKSVLGNLVGIQHSLLPVCRFFGRRGCDWGPQRRAKGPASPCVAAAFSTPRHAQTDNLHSPGLQHEVRLSVVTGFISAHPRATGKCSAPALG